MDLSIFLKVPWSPVSLFIDQGFKIMEFESMVILLLVLQSYLSLAYF